MRSSIPLIAHKACRLAGRGARTPHQALSTNGYGWGHLGSSARGPNRQPVRRPKANHKSCKYGSRWARLKLVPSMGTVSPTVPPNRDPTTMVVKPIGQDNRKESSEVVTNYESRGPLQNGVGSARTLPQTPSYPRYLVNLLLLAPADAATVSLEPKWLRTGMIHMYDAYVCMYV